MRRISVIGFGLLLTLSTAGGAFAQGVATDAPRAGETVLLCADGGWDRAGGNCASRGGVIGQQQIGNGVDGRASASGSFQVQPNALFPDGAGSAAPVRCGWARPCDSGE